MNPFFDKSIICSNCGKLIENHSLKEIVICLRYHARSEKSVNQTGPGKVNDEL